MLFLKVFLLCVLGHFIGFTGFSMLMAGTGILDGIVASLMIFIVGAVPSIFMASVLVTLFVERKLKAVK